MRLPIGVTVGLIAGIIFSTTWFLMAKSMGFYNVDVYVYMYCMIAALILLGVISSIIITKRKNGGLLDFKEALKAGMLYSLVFAITIAIFNFIYYKFIAPDTIDYFVAEAKKYVETVLKAKPEDVPKYLDAERAKFGSFRMIPPTLFWGLVVSLITGALLQKKPPHTFSEN